MTTPSIRDSQLRPGELELGPARVSIGLSGRVPPAMRVYVREIADLEVDSASRGQGFARELMAQVIAAADREGLALIVEVGAAADSSMDDQQLADWYGRLGFVTIQMPKAQPRSRRVMTRLVGGIVPKRMHYNARGEATAFEPPDMATATLPPQSSVEVH